jgi:predicted ATPase
LIHRVWPGAIVMDTTLHVHVGAIRTALGTNRSLLKTEQGRGYRLLGDWIARAHDPTVPAAGRQRMPARDEAAVTNFPATVTRLVGRTAAVALLRDLISAWRLVTLTGSGGIGKTSLAVKVARDALGEFADGGCFVELASLSDPALVPAAAAEALKVAPGPDGITPEAIARSISDKTLLMVLDNCEHVIEAVADLAETLLALCPHVTIITTSREILRVHGEHVYHVPPLDVPAPGPQDADDILSRSAVELFMARAKALDTGFSPGAAELPNIGAICRHLDGIPLAIEFAAAHASMFGIQPMAAGLHDRFALLTLGRRTAMPRHRTLRAMLDWSYEPLSEAEKRLFRHLAIFSGRFSIEAAAAVASDGVIDESFVIEGIANLVAKSLVVLDRDVASRWYLSETIRAYALEKFVEHDEHDAAAQRLAMYFRDLPLRSAVVSNVTVTEPTLRPCEPDNARAALDR